MKVVILKYLSFVALSCILLLNATGCKSEHQNEPDAPKYTTVPDMPVVSYSESTIDDIVHLHVKAFVNGSEAITATYRGMTLSNDKDPFFFTVIGSSIDTIILVPGTQLYDMKIYGTNTLGSGSTYSFTFGASAKAPYTLAVNVIGDVLTYDMSNNGNVDISDLRITSVQITDVENYIWIKSTAGNGEPIDISSLTTRGYYVLRVVANGRDYVKQFYRRI